MKGKQLLSKFFLKHVLNVNPYFPFYHEYKYAAFDLYSLALGIFRRITLAISSLVNINLLDGCPHKMTIT